MQCGLVVSELPAQHGGRRLRTLSTRFLWRRAARHTQRLSALSLPAHQPWQPVSTAPVATSALLKCLQFLPVLTTHYNVGNEEVLSKATLLLRLRSHRTRRCWQMLHTKNGTHCCHLECSHSIANNCKQHQRICKQICMEICLHVLCELGLTVAAWSKNRLQQNNRHSERATWVSQPTLHPLKSGGHEASSTLDAHAQRKQMEPVDVNGSIHTARKQHQRICVEFARVRPVWSGPE